MAEHFLKDDREWYLKNTYQSHECRGVGPHVSAREITDMEEPLSQEIVKCGLSYDKSKLMIDNYSRFIF